MGEANLFRRILISAEIRPRQGDILFTADSHLLDAVRQAWPDFHADFTMSAASCICNHVSLAVNQLLAVVAASDWRAN